MVESCMIKKTPNFCGNYSCQYIAYGRINVCSFRSYEEAVAYAYDIWGLTKVKMDMRNSIVLGR